MSKLKVALRGQTVELQLDQQLFVGLGLSVSGLIDMPQWWHRTSGSKLAEDQRGDAWLWRDLVISALQRLKETNPDALRAATKARAA